MTDRPPLAVPGEFVKRRYVRETVSVFAVDKNIVLKNEYGTFSVVSFDDFNANYVYDPEY